MTIPSLQHQISTWLSASILVAGLVAALSSFLLVHHRASVSQDAQLEQFAAALSRRSFDDIQPRYQPRDIEEAEMRFVVSPVGVPPGAADADVNVVFPTSLPDGLQTTEQHGTTWRVMITEDAHGRRFAVAQTLEARAEVALGTSLLVLLPILLLVPVLLLALRISLRRLFAPLGRLAREADQVQVSGSAGLTESGVPMELMPFVQAVNRLTERLAAALDQQRRLVADAAHELRSPVHALMIQAQNIRTVSMEPATLDRVDALSAGLERMSQLLEQLLGFARVQGRVARTASPIRLDDVVRSVVQSLVPIADAKGIDLGCTRLDAGLVVGNWEDAHFVVRNAVDNAIRYTPDGGTVDVAVEDRHDYVRFSVEDTGPGIDPADLERVFEPFVRILGSREIGSGLGLSIARAAAEALGGSIELSSRDGGSGLRFVYRQASAPAGPPQQHSHAGRKHGEAQSVTRVGAATDRGSAPQPPVSLGRRTAIHDEFEVR